MFNCSCCNTVRQSTEFALTRESIQDLQSGILRGVITPMHFESMHTNPTIRSQSLHLEESKAVHIITQFTEKEAFTFRDA